MYACYSPLDESVDCYVSCDMLEEFRAVQLSQVSKIHLPCAKLEESAFLNLASYVSRCMKKALTS